MKILFLSHDLQGIHLELAQTIDAGIKIIPFNRYIALIHKYHFFYRFYPIISLIYSLFIKMKEEDVLFADGGSSLYVGLFLKKRYRKVKLIYLDRDLFFYDSPTKITSLLLKNIDAVMSVSEQNKKQISKFLNVPIKTYFSYPRKLEKKKVMRKRNGLYVGRLDPDKNIRRIIEFGLQCPYFNKFFVIGDGAEKKYAKEMSEEHKKIIYFERKKNLAEYYSQCKFLIHIPNLDSHPRTTIEAAMCGCYPIISTGVGTKYLFDKIFIVNHPDDFKEINRKIKYILQNERRAKKLLRESLNRMPTKEQSLNSFKNEFNEIMKQIKN